jgi:hypothetical protein
MTGLGLASRMFLATKSYALNHEWNKTNLVFPGCSWSVEWFKKTFLFHVYVGTFKKEKEKEKERKERKEKRKGKERKRKRKGKKRKEKGYNFS